MVYILAICPKQSPGLFGLIAMLNVFLFTLVTLFLLGALFWLSQRARKDLRGADLLQTVSAETLLPQHYQYFPQVCRAISAEDARYLQLRATPAVRRAALRARRTVALKFLAGLRDDYRRLDRLARVLTTLAPSANQKREAQRIWLACKFELRWRMVWLEIWSGAAPAAQLQNMAGFIGALSARTQNAMNVLQESTNPTSVNV
jgi:hypothetical protein